MAIACLVAVSVELSGCWWVEGPVWRKCVWLVRSTHFEVNARCCTTSIMFGRQEIFNIDTPNRRGVLALGSNLLRVVELQLAWVWEVTNGSDPGKQ